MWTKPWTYKEGIAIGLMLPILGVMLQLCLGPINWDSLAMPVNAIILSIYVMTLIAAYTLRSKSYAIRWNMTYHAAVPAIIITGTATIVYGITCNRSTLSAWPFVVLYLWLTSILGLVSLQQIHHIIAGKRFISSSSSLISHLGLFMSIVAATLGSADMQKLRMTLRQGCDIYVGRAIDDEGKVHDLDFAIRLNSFAIDEYPPRLMFIDNETGNAITDDEQASLTLEDTVMTKQLLGHKIKVERVYKLCAMTVSQDTVSSYEPWSESGATTAALVSIDGHEAEWVSNGSYMFPYRSMKVDDKTSLVMSVCEPKRFTSNISIHNVKDEAEKNVDIEVNKPAEIEGWKIYQLSYDEAKGRWSDISVLELVYDPWMPAVYLGIFMLLAGAVLMFLTAGGKKI